MRNNDITQSRNPRYTNYNQPSDKKTEETPTLPTESEETPVLPSEPEETESDKKPEETKDVEETQDVKEPATETEDVILSLAVVACDENKKLNLRLRPSVDSPILKILDYGSNVFVEVPESEDEEWCKVHVDDVVGFCMYKFIVID